MDGRKLPQRRYTMLPVEKEERCPFRMIIYFKIFFFTCLDMDKAVRTKGTNVKTSAAHTTKSEIKTVKAMVQSPIDARGAASFLEKLTGKNIQQSKSPT
jgi:hypothetical protein